MHASRSLAQAALKVVTSPYLWSGLIALVIAQPHITLFLSILALPMLIWIGMSYWLLAAPALVLLGLLLLNLRLVKSWPGAGLIHSWACCLMLCAGWAAGTSRMGDVARSWGGKNMPFLEAFLWPYEHFTFILGL